MTSTKRAGPRVRSLHTVALAVVVALSLLLPLPAAWAEVPEMPTPTSIDMRILVVHTDTDYVPGQVPDAFTDDDPELEGIVDALARMGVPYDLLDARTQDLTPEVLYDGTGHGNYYGVILTSGNLMYSDPGTSTYPIAFTSDEFALLAAYESAFGVRQVNAVAPQWGPDDYGVTFGDDGHIGEPGLVGTLTGEGAAVFADLRSDVQLPIDNTWVYYAFDGGTAADVTPLIVDGAGHALAFTSTYGDPYPRETLSLMWVKNWYSLHSLLVWGGIIDWVTQGVHLGARHVNFSLQVDDLLMESEIWDPTANSWETGIYYRLDEVDFARVIAWQSGIRYHPLTSDFRLEMAFNGEGASPDYEMPGASADWTDTLTPAVAADSAAFTWVSHAYSHLDMNAPTTYAEATAELKDNDLVAKRTLKLRKDYDPTAFVQPDISGLENPEFLHAAADFGIKYLISDTSREDWVNPSPNTGIVLAVEPRLLVIPRRPTNLFYAVSTPDEWEDEYNFYYGPDGDWCNPIPPATTCSERSYEEILDVESDFLLRYLLWWDIDPIMFHQANLRSMEDTGTSVLGDLVEATLDKYEQYYTLPIRSLTQAEIGEEMLARMAAQAADVTATIVPCESATFVSTTDVTITVTGVSVNKHFTEEYGGDLISEVKLSAGSPQMYAISCEG